MRITGPTPRHPALFLCGLLFVAAAAMGIAPAADGDIWWHLAAGREMVARRALLFSDPFSVGAGGRAWADVHWLFQLGVYAVYRYSGLLGLVWAKCSIVGGSALVLLAALPRKPRSWVAPVFVTLLVAGLFAARGLLLLRPVIVTLFFIALYFLVLERFRRFGRARELWLLPLAQVAWANFQGLSAIGPALVAAYALAAGLELWAGSSRWFPFAHASLSGSSPRRQFRLQALALIGCAFASCLTPFGAAGLTLPAKLLGRLLPSAVNVYAHAIAENVPPFSLEQTSGEFWHLKWGFALLALALWCGGRRLQLAHLFLLSGFSALPLMSNRNVLLLYWVATPIAALYLAPSVRVWLLRWNRQRGQQLAFALNAGALFTLLGLGVTAAAHEPSLARPTPFRMPEASADFLTHVPGGSIFSADHQGGYLIWRLYPRFKPYIDTRLVLRSAEEFEEYLSIAEDPQRFAQLQAREHFAYVVLPVAYPDRYLGLIAALNASPEWQLVFSDGSEVLFARRDLSFGESIAWGDPQVSERLLAQAERQFRGAPELATAARLHLATLDVALGEFDEADRILSHSSQAEAVALRARARFGAGNVAGAETLAQELLRRDPRDVPSLNLMALIALRRVDRDSAVGYLRRAVGVDPFDLETGQILANLEANP